MQTELITYKLPEMYTALYAAGIDAGATASRQEYVRMCAVLVRPADEDVAIAEGRCP